MKYLDMYAFAIGYFSHHLNEPSAVSQKGKRCSWSIDNAYVADLTMTKDSVFAFIEPDLMPNDTYYALAGYCTEHGINYGEAPAND